MIIERPLLYDGRRSKASHQFIIKNAYPHKKCKSNSRSINQSFILKGTKQNMIQFSQISTQLPNLQTYQHYRRNYIYFQTPLMDVSPAKKEQAKILTLDLPEEHQRDTLHRPTKTSNKPYKNVKLKKVVHAQLQLTNFKIASYAHSHKGVSLNKDAIHINQDSYYANDYYCKATSLYIICDGHGQYGKQISSLTIQLITEKLKTLLQSISPVDALKSTISYVSQQISISSIDTEVR